MFEMTVDKRTGMMEQTHFIDAFTVEKKELFLSYLENKAFKVLKACKAIGIHPKTYYTHKEKDPVFSERVEGLKAEKIEDIEQTLADCAVLPEKTIDRIFFLKCWKPDRYNPVQKTESTQTMVWDVLGYGKCMKQQTAIDAEVIDNTHQTGDSQLTK